LHYDEGNAGDATPKSTNSAIVLRRVLPNRALVVKNRVFVCKFNRNDNFIKVERNARLVAIFKANDTKRAYNLIISLFIELINNAVLLFEK